MAQAQASDPARGDGRDKRWDDHRQARHEQILSTAITMIDRGEGDAGVAAIAAEAGIPRSVVYRLFRDREDLDEQVRRRIVEDMLAEIGPLLVAKGTIRSAVKRATATYVRWVEEHSELHRFLGAGSAAHPQRGSRAMLGGKAGFARLVHGLVQDVMDDVAGGRAAPVGLAAHLAYGLTGMTDSVVNAWLAADEATRGSTARLSRFLVAAACGQIMAAAEVAGVEIDLDRRL